MTKNRIVLSSGRVFEVDLNSYTFSFAAMIEQAKESGDEEIQLRSLQALVVMAIGMPEFISTPVWQIPELMQKIIFCLTDEPVGHRKYDDSH